VNLNMPTGILREVPRDDASARLLTHPAPDIDISAAEDAVRSLLVALGQDPEAEHLRQTPRRVAAASQARMKSWRTGFEVAYAAGCHRRSIVKSAGHSLPTQVVLPDMAELRRGEYT